MVVLAERNKKIKKAFSVKIDKCQKTLIIPVPPKELPRTIKRMLDALGREMGASNNPSFSLEIEVNSLLASAVTSPVFEHKHGEHCGKCAGAGEPGELGEPGGF